MFIHIFARYQSEICNDNQIAGCILIDGALAALLCLAPHTISKHILEIDGLLLVSIIVAGVGLGLVQGLIGYRTIQHIAAERIRYEKAEN